MRFAPFVVSVIASTLCLGVGEVSARPDATPLAADSFAKSKKRKKERTTPAPTSTPSPKAAPKAAPPRPPAPVQLPTPAPVALTWQRQTLPNGLRVILHPDPHLPAIAVSVGYPLGHSFESMGQRGFANAVYRHLRDVGTDQPLPRSTETFGPDLTVFTTVASPARLPSVLWREAHRLSRPIDTDAFSNLRTSEPSRDRSPQGARWRAERLAYQGCWPYGHAAFGWTHDLQLATADSLDAFRRLHTSPARIVVTITGRFDEATALDQLQQLFGPMAPGPHIPTPEVVLPDQTNQRVDVEKSAESTPQFFLYGWAVPPAGHADLVALRLVMAMLQDRSDTAPPARSTRLEKLPEEAKLRLELDERAGPSMLTLRVDFPASLDIDRVRKVVDDALLDLATYGPSTDEMLAAWRSLQLSHLHALSSIDSRSALLTRAELLHGNPDAVGSLPTLLATINRDEVRSAARRHLTPIRRNLVEHRGPRVDPPKPPQPPSPPTKTSPKSPKSKSPKAKSPKSKPSSTAAPQKPPRGSKQRKPQK